MGRAERDDQARKADSDSTNSSRATSGLQIPTLTLPKGGGAIRGIGEKFAANPVTGTSSVSVPIATSPGRSGFGPQLSISYDSGAGNTPFGLGWSSSLPFIAHKTDKGLPEYHRPLKSHVFVLSGNDDLVHALTPGPGGGWIPEVVTRMVNGAMYRIDRYRPRIEGLFARIERWSNQATPSETFWRSISRDNITTWYGRTADSRIADPSDAARTFTWLICESHDDKGNVVAYEYKRENSDNVDGSQVHERHRTPDTRKANQYLKRVRYGNVQPYFPRLTPSTAWPTLPPPNGWHFEVVFDYGEHDTAVPTPDGEVRPWPRRLDPFSSYRAAFEIRTYRLCRRVLMFHRFPEVGVAPCLVASTDFTHRQTTLASYLTTVGQSGYKRRANGTYLRQSLPSLEFVYSEGSVDPATPVRHVEDDTLMHLPEGIDGTRFALTDLEGEGLSGILSKQGAAWFYKRNLSPIAQSKEAGRVVTHARFAPALHVGALPSLAVDESPQQQFIDLAGDGTLDAVSFHGPAAGFYERTPDRTWEPLVPFRSLPTLDWSDRNIRFIDLTGDGHADLVVAEDTVLVWYPSLGEDGFAPAEQVRCALDDGAGPRCVFDDPQQTIFLADMTGDGLTDIVRIRHAEVCYWPNLGYGRFGAKIDMDRAPAFDTEELFEGARIRLADIDGSGVADIIYLAADGPRLYFNQSGNQWSIPTVLSQCPPIDNISSVLTADLLGNGTACLVWSSPLAAHVHQPLRYIELMAEKPHLLTRMQNNLGAETRVHYAPSTKFYLADEQAGQPWITRIPFPVHVVERVETFDWISRSRFVTRYAYHHGYFDGEEREFRGFGLVEQFDTEEFSALAAAGTLPLGDNVEKASHVPPARTKTWFHTGAFLEGEAISLQFAREYFGAPSRGDPSFDVKFAAFLQTLLPDTIMPPTLTVAEEREACRALKGSILRTEVYARDGSLVEDVPYTTAEQNYSLEVVQPRGSSHHAVFSVHPRESVNSHHERNATDPRVGHQLVLQVDAFGNVQRSVEIGYRRRVPAPGIPEQAHMHMTAAVSRVVNRPNENDWYRIGLPIEARSFEVVKPPFPKAGETRLAFDDVRNLVESLFPIAQDAPSSSQVAPYEDWDWRDSWVPTVQPGGPGVSKLRVIEHARTYYRKDNLTATLPLGQVESLAIPHDSLKLAFTPGLLTQIYGSKVSPALMSGDGKYVHSEGDANWWMPSGQTFFSPGSTDPAPQELAHARLHFFLPCRYRDPFHTSAVSTETIVTYDGHDLIPVRRTDAVGNTVTAEIDYRVLQARLVTDPNGNRAEAAFDALGMVAGTAVMGKPGQSVGDILTAFEADLTDLQVSTFFGAADPHLTAPGLLKSATSRIVYDVHRFARTRVANPGDPLKWEPAVAATLARATHARDALPPQGLKIQISVAFSDGLGRHVQQKVQAEPGPVVAGGPTVTPRWVGTGWTIFNNKGRPVRQYEPFFSATHMFEFARLVGVSPILFYDPLDRVVATLHPNHTFEKVVFDAWRQASWDANDTLELTPKIDPDVSGFFTRLPDAYYLPTWFTRASMSVDANEKNAAKRTEAHADTPSVTHVDSLGRAVQTVADNGVDGLYESRVEVDVEGNERAVTDALGRIVMRYDYDQLGARIRQSSMEAGTRWTLSDVAGKPIRGWGDRGFIRRLTYDALRRPVGVLITDGVAERLAEETIYGEDKPLAATTNHRGQVWQTRDDAGIVTSVSYDFKGNLLSGTRDLRTVYKVPVDWAATPAPATSEKFTSLTAFDALNRMIEATSPDGSITTPGYNDANLLERVGVRLRGAATATSFVRNIDYNAKSQRTRIDYNTAGAPLFTEYTYDPDTFRLTRLRTVRPNHADAGARTLQDLRYTYDPAGNITHIQDDAQQAIYFRNRLVDADRDYAYDAIYRLIQARGREHLGLALAPTPPDPFNTFHINHVHPGDGNAVGTYVETFVYDAAGNFKTQKHDRTDVATSGWTRTYAYNEASLLEPPKESNRLSQTVVAGTVPSIESYTYDAHGNIMTMPHLAALVWDAEDQLREVDLGGGGKAFYVYDAAGQRVRKVIERIGGNVEERIYLGHCEVYRTRVAGMLSLERETLHVMDDKQRVALVDTRTQGAGGVPAQLIRYQLADHLGSASIEVDDAAQIVSYEEYFPYGATSYQAVDTTREVPRKRYRYTGKERDEETGFNYHGARYYAPWLGRWTSCDPAGTTDSNNLYAYVRQNPVRLLDSDGRQSADSAPVVHVTEEEQRILRANKEVLAPIERDFERDANSGAHAKPVVNPGTNPDSLRVGWVFGTHAHSVAPQRTAVPDTGSNVLNYGLGALYSWRNLAAALDSVPLATFSGVNQELDRRGIPLEALPLDAFPLMMAERTEYLAARASQALNTSRLTLPLPGLGAGGIGMVSVRLGGVTVVKPPPRPPKVYIDKYLTDKMQGFTDTAAAAADADKSAFLGYNTSHTPPWLLRIETGHAIEGQVGHQLTQDPVVSKLIEPISYGEQAAGKGLLGDFRLKPPLQDMWHLKQWDVTTPGQAWRKLQRGADRTWLTY